MLASSGRGVREWLSATGGGLTPTRRFVAIDGGVAGASAIRQIPREPWQSLKPPAAKLSDNHNEGRRLMAPQKKVLMAASGDWRQSANETCWPAQEAREKQVVAALDGFGVEVERAHPYDPALRHGFIASQKQGLEVFSKVDPDLPIVVAEAVWQYTNHVLPGLIGHRGPILTLANWSGQWPGLVGMLNLNGSLTKAGVPYSTLWSESFTDEPFKRKLGQWLTEGRVSHDASHVHAFDPASAPHRAREAASEIADGFRRRRAIMGVFDEGCMGMYN